MQNSDIDEVMGTAVRSKIGLFEVRIWYYALFMREGSRLPNLWGRLTPVSAIYLNLDQPGQFIEALRTRTRTPLPG